MTIFGLSVSELMALATVALGTLWGAFKFKANHDALKQDLGDLSNDMALSKKAAEASREKQETSIAEMRREFDKRMSDFSKDLHAQATSNAALVANMSGLQNQIGSLTALTQGMSNRLDTIIMNQHSKDSR